jgi:anti-sigma regulatory factor (Ser/Thr protein kinase)
MSIREVPVSAFVVQRLERRPDAARAARAAVRDLCGDRLTGERLTDVELVVSELVTNAVRHGAGQITLTVTLACDNVTLSVLDEGRGRPQLRQVETHSSHGHGLALVARLADDWQVRESIGGVGKEVWCVLSATAIGREQPVDAVG